MKLEIETEQTLPSRTGRRSERRSRSWRRLTQLALFASVVALQPIEKLQAEATPAEPTPADATLADARSPQQPQPEEPAAQEVAAWVVVLDELRHDQPAEAAGLWADRLADALEAAGYRVVGRSVLSATDEEALPGAAPAPSDETLRVSEGVLRSQARERGGNVVVFARVAPLGARAGVDLRVLPVAEGSASLKREVLAVDDPARLDWTVGKAARLASGALASWTPRDERAPVLADRAGGSAPAIATAEESARPRVSEVRIRGNRRIDGDAILAVTKTAPGETLTNAQLAKDVRRIHELGFFRDIQVLVDSSDDSGVEVEFVVEENPVIRRVTLSGNDSVDADDIKENLTLAVGATIDYPLVIENQQRIEGYYQAQGFYTAQVRYQVEPVSEGTVGINYDVSEGELLRLREVVFEGNAEMEDAELMKGFQTKPWGFLSFITRFWDNSGRYMEPVFYQDLEKVRRRYQDAGFIRARLSEPEVELGDGGLRVTVNVDEGPQYQVGSVEVAGDDSMDRSQLQSLVEMQPGSVFSRSTLSDDVERLRLHYADLGFFNAQVRPRTRVNPDTLTVDCILEAEKGELFFVDRIQVAGNTRTRDEVVRRELSLVEGELYSAAALRRSRARLQRLGFFEEVAIESRPVDADRVAVDVDVVERPTGSFTFGAGFGSTDGFLLNGAIRQDNLFGKAYGLNLQADLGSRNQRAFVRFTDPFFRGTPASLSTGLDFSSVEFEDFDRAVSSFNLNLSYPLDEGETRVGSGYSFSDQEIDSDFDRGVASLVQREEFGGRSTTSAMSFQVTRDTRDDPRFPRLGTMSGMTFEVAGLGGVNQFLRFEVRRTAYRPFSLLGLDSTFVFNTRAGYALPLNSLSDFDLDGCESEQCLALTDAGNSRVLAALSDIDEDLELPLSERFILGGVGAFQVRGYETRSLGPRRSRLVVDRAADDGTLLFRPLNRNAACNDPDARAGLADDACNDLDDTDPDDFDDLDLTDVIGGNKMFLANLEMRVPVSEDLGITGIWFFDMGNAFAEDESFSFTDLRFGTGLGAEWLSPFGPLVVYLGVPLDRLEDEKATVFEFSLGGSSF